jgi:hypothetical protein
VLDEDVLVSLGPWRVVESILLPQRHHVETAEALQNAWINLRIVLMEAGVVVRERSVGPVVLVNERAGQADAQAVWVFRNVWIVLRMMSLRGLSLRTVANVPGNGRVVLETGPVVQNAWTALPMRFFRGLSLRIDVAVAKPLLSRLKSGLGWQQQIGLVVLSALRHVQVDGRGLEKSRTLQRLNPSLRPRHQRLNRKSLLPPPALALHFQTGNHPVSMT